MGFQRIDITGAWEEAITLGFARRALLWDKLVPGEAQVALQLSKQRQGGDRVIKQPERDKVWELELVEWQPGLATYAQLGFC